MLCCGGLLAAQQRVDGGGGVRSGHARQSMQAGPLVLAPRGCTTRTYLPLPVPFRSRQCVITLDYVLVVGWGGAGGGGPEDRAVAELVGSFVRELKRKVRGAGAGTRRCYYRYAATVLKQPCAAISQLRKAADVAGRESCRKTLCTEDLLLV